MRKPVLLIGTNAIILIAIFLLLAQSLVVAQKVAHSVHVRGSVQFQHSGQGSFMSLQEGSPLKPGDVIHTGPGGTTELTWLDGTRIKVLPNSNLLLQKASYNSVRHTEDSELKLNEGKIFVRVVKPMADGSKFAILTPSATASVHGTVFSVAADPGKTEVSVFRGSVSVQQNGDGASSSATTFTVVPGHDLTLIPYGNIRKDVRIGAEPFEAEPTIIQPALEARLSDVKDGQALLQIASESGNKVTVNGQSADEVSTGIFSTPVKVAGVKQSFTVTSTDKHGLSSTVVETYNPPVPPAPCHAAPSGA